MGSPSQICPICNNSGTVKKRTRKKSGKRYDYEVYNHEGLVHRARVDASPAVRVEKNWTRKRLIELLNSTRFRRAIFSSKDIVAEFEKSQMITDYRRIRRNLLKLAESGMVSIVRSDRKIFFVNSSSQERLDYILKRVSIILEDDMNEGTFESHYFKVVILNDNEFPLHYIQFRATGDNPRDRNQLSFYSYDVTRREEAVIFFLEDDPQKKRILIEPRVPIQPDERRSFSIEYSWPERGPSYTFTAPTPLDLVQFSLVARNDFELAVTRTNAGRTVTEDVSFRVISTIREDKLKVKRFEMKNIPAFAVLKFKWKRQ